MTRPEPHMEERRRAVKCLITKKKSSRGYLILLPGRGINGLAVPAASLWGELWGKKIHSGTPALSSPFTKAEGKYKGRKAYCHTHGFIRFIDRGTTPQPPQERLPSSSLPIMDAKPTTSAARIASRPRVVMGRRSSLRVPEPSRRSATPTQACASARLPTDHRSGRLGS